MILATKKKFHQLQIYVQCIIGISEIRTKKMAMTDYNRRDLARLIDIEATLRKQFSQYQLEINKLEQSAQRYVDQARRASSPSSAQIALRTSVRESEKAAKAGEKLASVGKKIADNAKAQASRRNSLEASEKSDQNNRDRENERRMQKEKAHFQEIKKLSSPTIHYVHIKQPEMEKLRVLYLTSNPTMNLRTDAEIRQVQQALRGARYRDLVTIQQRPAATFQDLIDGLNDVRPHIIHFSGHAGSGSLILEGGELEGGNEKIITYQLLFKALSSTDSPPILLVLNA